MNENPVEVTEDTVNNNDALPSLKINTSQLNSANQNKAATFSPIFMGKNEQRKQKTPTKSRPPERFKQTSPFSQRKIQTAKSAPPDKAYSDEEIESSLNAYLQDGEEIDPQMKCYVTQYLNRQRINEVISGRYMEAKKIDNTIKEINEGEKNRVNCTMRNMQMEYLTERKSEQQALYDNENEKWNQISEAKKEENQKSMNALKEKHLQEVEKFKEKWTNPNFLEQKCKPSQQLLQLRYKESKLALMKDYDSAEAMRALADEQQLKEEEMNKKIIEEIMTKEFLKMKERHKKEEAAANEHHQKMLDLIELQRGKALKYYVCTDKPSAFTKTPMYIDVEIGASTSLNTPRTAKSLAEMKTGRITKLVPPHFDESTFEKLENIGNRPNTQKKTKRVQRKRSSSAVNRRLLPAL